MPLPLPTAHLGFQRFSPGRALPDPAQLYDFSSIPITRGQNFLGGGIPTFDQGTSQYPKNSAFYFQNFNFGMDFERSLIAMPPEDHKLPSRDLIPNDFAERLINAIRKGDNSSMKNLCKKLKAAKQLNQVYPENGTALHIAIHALIAAHQDQKNLTPYIANIKDLVFLSCGNIDTTIKDHNQKHARKLLLDNGQDLPCYLQIYTTLVNSERRHEQNMYAAKARNSISSPQNLTTRVTAPAGSTLKFTPVAKGIVGRNKSQFLSPYPAYPTMCQHPPHVVAPPRTAGVDSFFHSEISLPST